jgi:hypothetical protein
MQEMFPIDTNKTIAQLTDAGIKKPHAEAIVVAICDAREKDVKYLATKTDLEAAAKDLGQEIQSVRNDMKLIEISIRHDMKAVESRLDHKIDQVESRLITAIHKMESSMKTWFLSLTLTVFVTIIAKLLF